VRSSFSFHCTWFYILLFSATSFAAEKRTTQDNIVLGSSSALTGPAAQLGTKLNQGARLYFDKINQTGGIAGRKIELISLDDGYEPFRTLQNTHQLIDKYKVLALFNYVGTPTSHAILSILKSTNIPYLMPFTGADFLRGVDKHNIVNLRASYYQEVHAQIKYLVETVKAKKIGLLIQADEFGLAVEAGYLQAMKDYGIKPTVTTRYRRNTENIDLALTILKKKQVDAVAFVGTYKPFAKLINTGAEFDFNPFYSTVSFISSHDLYAGIKQPSKVLVTQVMPDPNTCQLAICHEFMSVSKSAKIGDVDEIMFEGYLNAKLLVVVIKQCEEQELQACIIKTFNSLSYDLGGIKVNYSKNNNQGSEQVYLKLSH
jgi:ABC-type branched-subunit amino acid transport system substrate-binding protein